MTSKLQMLSIYKSMLRESQKFPNYNFRTYALRRIRYAFKDGKNVSEGKEVNRLVEFAKENLNMIRRQASIGDMYRTDKLVIEAK